MSFKPPGQCPACGEWVPRNAAACDCCGACDRSGWQPDRDVYDGLDLPEEDDFDYHEFVEREFGAQDGGAPHTRTPEQRRLFFWRCVGAVLLLVMILGYLLAVFR